MRKSNTQRLSDVLKIYAHENKIERKLSELDLIKSWETIVGRIISQYTQNIYIKNDTLFVEITSPIVRNELMMMREEIRCRLNDTAGKELIKTIIFR